MVSYKYVTLVSGCGGLTWFLLAVAVLQTTVYLKNAFP